MTRTHISWSALGLVIAVGASVSTACDNKSSGGTTPATPSASASTAAVAPSASASAASSAAPSGDAGRAEARNERRFGFAGMLFAAADRIDLNDDQTAKLDALEDPLDDKDPAWKDEMKSLHADLLAGIRAGKIDTAKMQPHFAAIDKAAQARQDKEATALNGLWALLDAAQRKRVVGDIRAKQAEREARWGKRDGGAGDGGGPGAAPDFSKRRLEKMTKELDLDDAQQKSIAAILAKGPGPKEMETKRAEGKKRMDALLTAFDGAAFDAKKLEMGDAPKRAHDMMDKQVQFFGQLLPVLKPEQREKLAAKMERGHGDGSRGHGRGMHGPEQGYNGFPFEEEHND